MLGVQSKRCPPHWGNVYLIAQRSRRSGKSQQTAAAMPRVRIHRRSLRQSLEP
ncbi:Uncharacterised protein [Vibrio cholerae]|nr:Uncharacterised protein [Vibrio cholerae]